MKKESSGACCVNCGEEATKGSYKHPYCKECFEKKFGNDYDKYERELRLHHNLNYADDPEETIYFKWNGTDGECYKILKKMWKKYPDIFMHPDTWKKIRLSELNASGLKWSK